MILNARNLVKAYQRRPVVDGVCLEVNPGEIVGLLGPNGAGKTTTFHLIVGLIPCKRGEIYLGDEEITGMPMYVRARKGIGYLAQEPSVFRKLTVKQNILAVLETLQLSRGELEARLESLLKELGLSNLANRRADGLSGGEARRLEITRALARRPRFLLLDEPFAGIDPKAVEDIQAIIRALKDRRIGLLITDHNVRETLAITDRSYILSSGRILTSGSPTELAENAEVRRVYLGDRFRLD
ncbi:MAG: LPS export ABC transporter ATP-binding protein [Gemmatimonadetes bacterium]|nr:LPS export ABC transporter ATP-binding protein [Gemmatimonadota bacterium]MDE3256798.1 LPS export ABC transporter ATP-binding protein [Gemmatimonadota bacterium]